MVTTTEHADFDNFREGGSSLTNVGGNEAAISNITTFLEYGVTDRFTASLMVPYVHKVQTTSQFGKRVASGIGDLAVFGRFEVVKPEPGIGPSLSLGLGVKFPTGGIEEPRTDQARLPPAFQVGSGGYDVVPTVSYYHSFGNLSFFGSSFLRLPLNDNKVGYRFGREFQIHVGGQYPLPFWGRRLELLGSIDALSAKHDTDSELILPDRLRDGTKVLNTGGRFIDLTPGIRVRAWRDLAVQARFFVPVMEDWNGLRSRNVGQVAPNVTMQLSVAYQLNLGGYR
ncbi:MAG: hypothetical protein GEU99_07775 [Luteitalea sp.]|nr:hypothetical protein [Luteitalea sp.]